MDLDHHFLQKDPLAQRLGLEKEFLVSSLMSQAGPQDPFRYRARYLGLKVACLLIDEDGHLSTQNLEELLLLFERGVFYLGHEREADALLYQHLQSCLQMLKQDPKIWALLKKFSPPLCHKKAEELILETLGESKGSSPQTYQIRRAALCSWLTLLRQATGSCFATAPAMLIQKESPELFFKDLYDLLTLGQLKRVYDQNQIAVPLIASFTSMDLKAKVRAPFFGLQFALESVGSLWSLQKQEKMASWGLLSVEELFQRILLDEMGLEEKDLKEEEDLKKAQMAHFLAKQQEIYYPRKGPKSMLISEWKKRLRDALFSFRTLTDCALLRAWEYTLASFSDIKTEFSKWNLYIGLGFHPDDPGGVGAFIYNYLTKALKKLQDGLEAMQKEYEEGLNSLRALEMMMQNAGHSARIHQIKADWSLAQNRTSFLLEEIERGGKKANAISQFFPWIMELLDARLQDAFQEVFDPALSSLQQGMYEDSPAGFRLVYKNRREDASKWSRIESEPQYIEALRDFFSSLERDVILPELIEQEEFSSFITALIQFVRSPSFIETAMKRAHHNHRLSPWDYISGGTLQTLLMVYFSRKEPFDEKRVIPRSGEELISFLSKIETSKPLLMHSPTHAFVFYPELLEKKREFVKRKEPLFSEEMQEFLAHKLALHLPTSENRALFFHTLRNLPSVQSKEDVKRNLESSIQDVKDKKALVASIFYENFCILNREEAKEALFQMVPSFSQDLEGNFFGSLDIYEMAKKEIQRRSQKVFHAQDVDLLLAEKMRNLGLLPSVFIFADSNWSGWFFGFLKEQKDSSLELWRFNRVATRGFPMLDWKCWLSEENRASWVVLTSPEEYRFGINRLLV